jgi:ankyrin repeat protein
MSAILRDCESSVSLALITHGANIHTVDNDDRTTLMIAGWKGRIDVVERLLRDGSIVKKKDTRGRNIWHHVASVNTHVRDEDIVKLLGMINENDASVNDTDNQERTPLHLCSIFATLNIAKALLESKRAIVGLAEPNENKTALHFAAAYGDHAMVKLLVGNGADRFALCNGNLLPLHLACGSEADNVDAVKILLASDADAQLNARTEDNMTPLHIAAAHGHIAIVETLLRTPDFTNVDAHCQGGWTALHLACGRQLADHPPTDSTRVAVQGSRYLAVVKALLEGKSQVNKKSQTSRTALHIAAEFGHVDIVKLLLAQKDVQFAAKDSHGNTPLLDAARSEQRNEILPLLAPWTARSIEALPINVKKTAQDFDANVIDFEKTAGARPRRHKIPVFDLLYKPSSEQGAISRKGVSTRPDPSNKGGFRWIHLPANNLHWCHTLLTKHFIEGDFEDVDGFKDLERTLSQQQYRGRKTHSQFMRPTCSVPSGQPGAHGHINKHVSGGAFHPERANSLEVIDADSAPPDPKDFTPPTDKDLSGLTHPELDRRGSGGLQNFKPAQLWSPPANRATSGQTVPESPSKIKTQPGKELDSTADDSFRAFLFLPYLALESKRNVNAMDERSERTITPGDRDIRLHQAYFDWKANDYGLHIRRTLDQFFYRNVDTRQRDNDQVVLRYQRKEKQDAAERKNPGDVSALDDSEQDFDILMVDQLWVWVLGPGLVVTSFPQKWQQSRRELPDLLSSVLEKLDPRTGDPVQSIYGLAACIVGQCMSTCDRAMYQSHKASIFDMFSGSVGNAMNEEVKLFSRFEKASVIASRWVKRTLQHNTIKDSKERQNLETSYDKALQSVSPPPKHADSESSGTTDEPSFVEDLLDIQHETHLLEEVKDIRDELGILLQVTEEQQLVHGEILTTFHPALKPGSNSSDQQKIEIILGEQNFSLHQQKIEIKNMMKQVGSVYKSIRDLLDHKQKHANAIEARYARKQASDTAKAGRTLMVFTTVTVIFLPLSFLAAFFAISIKELPTTGTSNKCPWPSSCATLSVSGWARHWFSVSWPGIITASFRGAGTLVVG